MLKKYIFVLKNIIIIYICEAVWSEKKIIIFKFSLEFYFKSLAHVI